MDHTVIVHLDGEWVDEKAAGIPINDRGFLFADGVFETALLHRGRYFHLMHHLERFRESAATLGIMIPPVTHVEALCNEIAERNALRDGSLRITCTAGARDGERGTLLITLSPRDQAWVDKAARGWNIITAETRRPSTRAVPAQLKALGRTYALLARREARNAGVDDALLLTDNDEVCEGPAWNVFWRRGDNLFTPDLDIGVLAGITRSMLMDHARNAGYIVQEGRYKRSDLEHADEIFATMTSVGLARIRTLDGRALPRETPAADALYRLYWQDVDAYCSGGRE